MASLLSWFNRGQRVKVIMLSDFKSMGPPHTVNVPFAD